MLQRHDVRMRELMMSAPAFDLTVKGGGGYRQGVLEEGGRRSDKRQ